MPSNASKCIHSEILERFLGFPTKVGMTGWNEYKAKAEVEAKEKGISFIDLLKDDIQELESSGKIGQIHVWTMIIMDGFKQPEDPYLQIASGNLTIDDNLYDGSEAQEFIRQSKASEFLQTKLDEINEMNETEDVNTFQQPEYKEITNQKIDVIPKPIAPTAITPQWVNNVQNLINQPFVVGNMLPMITNGKDNSSKIANGGMLTASLGASNIGAYALGLATLNPLSIPALIIGSGIAWFMMANKDKTHGYGYHCSGKHVISLSIVEKGRKCVAVLEYYDEGGIKTIKSREISGDNRQQRALNDVKAKYCNKFGMKPENLVIKYDSNVIHVRMVPDKELADKVTNMQLRELNSLEQMKLRANLNPTNPANYPTGELSKDYPINLEGRPVVVDYKQKGKHSCYITDIITKRKFGPYDNLSVAKKEFAKITFESKFIDGLQIPDNKKAIQLPHNGLLIVDKNTGKNEIDVIMNSVKNQFIIFQEGDKFEIYNKDGQFAGILQKIEFSQAQITFLPPGVGKIEFSQAQITFLPPGVGKIETPLTEIIKHDTNLDILNTTEEMLQDLEPNTEVDIMINGENLIFSYEIIGEEIVGYFTQAGEVVTQVIGFIKDPVRAIAITIATLIGGPLLAVPIGIMI